MRFTVVALCLLFTAWIAASAGQVTTMTPQQALTALQDGNARFAGGTATHPHADTARMIETAASQAPFATVVGCSDSRVPLEIIFDQGIGDIFPIRVAGAVCDKDEIGSIEYGVSHLGTPLLVILGHSSCGAVTAVATGDELHGCIPELVDNINAAVLRAQTSTGLTGAAVVPEAVKENVWQSIADLLYHSATAANAVKAGTLKIEGAIYDLTTGSVQWLGPHPNEADLLIVAPTDPDDTRYN